MGGTGAPPVVLHGTLPDQLDVAPLQDACGDRPALRKTGTGLAVMLPDAPARWVIWLLDHVPAVTALPGLVEKLGHLTRDLRPQATPVSQNPEKGIVEVLLQRLAQSERRDRANVAQMLADACVETGLARMAVVARWRRAGVRHLYLSDARLAPLSDELRHLIRAHVQDTPVQRDLTADDLTADGLDGALLNDMTGSRRILVNLPARDTPGLALVLCDPVAVPPDLGRQLDALDALAVGRKPAKPRRRKFVQAAVAAGLLAGLVWLAVPAPVLVTANAVSEPRGAIAVALPVAGFVDQIAVRVGDTVTEGAAIARFRAPDLEEQNATLGIDLAMESVVAQTALSTNDYGAFLLSQQKIEAATLRQRRVQDRLAALDMRVPVAGRVVAAMGPDTTGRFIPMGETVAVVQPTAEFVVNLTVSRVDAAWLQRGQQGEVWFRGLSDRSWPLETETPVVQQRSPDGSADQLTLRARLVSADQDDLFAGLAGYARIEVGQQMRARVLSRYVTEYVRGKAWIWFGLTF